MLGRLTCLCNPAVLGETWLVMMMTLSKSLSIFFILLEKQMALMAPLSEQTEIKENKFVMAPLCLQKTDKKTPQVQKVGRKKVWKKLKNGLFGWKLIKLSDKNPSNDLCGSEILPSKFKTLEETNQGKYSKKTKRREILIWGLLKD